MHHHREHFWWKFFPKEEMTEIYITVALRAFVMSLLNLFVPIYLYVELGHSLRVTLMFFIVYAAVFGLISPFVGKVAARIGLKHSMLLSVPLYITYFLMLYGLRSYPIPPYFVGAIFGVANAFFWISFHMEFTQFSHHNHRGEEIGKRQAIGLGASLLGPLLGGVLIDFIGFAWLFFSAGVLMFLSIIFLFLSKEVHVPFRFSFRDAFKREYFKDGVVFIGRGIWNASTWVLWPMFIFLILRNYTSLGILGSVIGAVTSMMVFVVGKASDKVNKRKMIKFGAMIDSVSWFVRNWVFTVAQVFGLTVFSSLAYIFVEVPMSALVYDKAQKRKKTRMEYFIWREIFLNIGRIIVLLSVFLTGRFFYGFILTGLSNFVYLLF